MIRSGSPERGSDSRRELADWLRLTLAPGVGGGRQRQLLSAYGLPGNILSADRGALERLVGAKAAYGLLEHDSSKQIEDAFAWLDEGGNHIVTLADPAYPASLLEMADPPTLLYVKGRIELLSAPSIAMVGARSATAQGLADARAFAAALSAAGLCVVSGLAIGIDAAAHEGGLKAEGATVAVIGTGADRIYPARNAALARRIAAEGAVVSEYPLGAQPLQHHFPRRNRLIAGLSRGVLVVEAAIGSGSLITARLAAEQGREVFAIPGSIHSPLSKGCHRLIRDGAKLVETAEDVLEELCWPHRETPQGGADATVDRGGDDAPDAARLLAALGHDPVTLDTLLQRSGLTPETLSAMLLTMELDGRVSRLPGGRFQRLHV